MTFATEISSWTIALFAALFWLIQYSLKRFVRLWALLTLPATLLHELAHTLVGVVLAARPTSMSLWPRRVSATGWRLGFVAFQRLRWWNGGAVALAPLIWLLLIFGLVRHVPMLPPKVSVQTGLALGVGSIWLWIAFAPSRSDWKLAIGYWPSALAFLLLWTTSLYLIVRTWV
jgi:hypothetical protein